MTSADVLLHPVRMRIWQAFLGDRALTVKQLRDELPDVPAASLYRHVTLLAERGVLSVAAEQRVGGAVERTYVLRTAASTVGDRELRAMTPSDHRAAFTAYMTGLLGDFDRYLQRGDIDLRRDGVGYHVLALWLDDDEFHAFTTELAELLQTWSAKAEKPGRTRRILGTVLLPASVP